MGREELYAAIDAVAAIGRQDIWDRAFFVNHNYGVNHPPAYPYDALSQQTKPGLTILEDPISILAFLAFAHWMQERIGFVLPIIGGEGGGPLGDKTETIAAVAAIPPIERQFSWSTSGAENGDGEENDEDDSTPGDGEAGPTDPPPQWDSRLDALGVRLTRSTAPQAWRLIAAHYRDVNESDNKHHIYINARQADGTPVPAARFLVDWVGRRPDETPGLLTTDAAGMANLPCSSTCNRKSRMASSLPRPRSSQGIGWTG